MKTLQAFKKLPRLLFAGRFAYDFDGMPLMTGRLPLRKRLNLLKCGVDQLRRGERPWAMPPAVQVEPTNRCNLSCPLCPTGTTVGKRPAGAMSRETFRRILEQMGDHLVAAVLYSWGEPFLNRDLPGMISDCTARGILSVTSTNGHFLQTQEEALAVVDSGLSALVIALDGSTQEIYQSYRHGGDMEKVKRCAEMVERAKALRRSATPYTNLRTVVTSANVDDLPNLERLARDLGVNMYSCKSLGCLVKSPAMTQYDSADERYSRFAGPKRKSRSAATSRSASRSSSGTARSPGASSIINYPRPGARSASSLSVASGTAHPRKTCATRCARTAKYRPFARSARTAIAAATAACSGARN